MLVLHYLFLALIYYQEKVHIKINTFLNSIYGKFVILGLTWSFSFQILSEIRHLFMDYGLGFDLKVANITGSLVILGSIIFTVLIFILGRNLI